MTNFNTQVGSGVYRMQFETDNQRAYKVVKEIVRSFVDMDSSNEVAVSKMEKTTHTEHSSACGGVCTENTEVKDDE